MPTVAVRQEGAAPCAARPLHSARFGKHAMQRAQRQLPAVLCLQHSVDRPEVGAVRTWSASVGNQHLVGRIRHKTAVITKPEAKGDDAAEVAIALALVPLHLRYALGPVLN